MENRYRNTLTRSGSASKPAHWFARLLALVFLLLCVAIGMAGLILPVIPGLLFLALACMIAATIFPPLERYLRRYPGLSIYLDRMAGFHRLAVPEKIRFVGWLLVRLVIDSFRCLLELLARLLSTAGRFERSGP